MIFKCSFFVLDGRLDILNHFRFNFSSNQQQPHQQHQQPTTNTQQPTTNNQQPPQLPQPPQPPQPTGQPLTSTFPPLSSPNFSPGKAFIGALQKPNRCHRFFVAGESPLWPEKKWMDFIQLPSSRSFKMMGYLRDL